MREKATKGKFRVSWLPGEYEGYVFNGPADKWNGHPLPYFSQEEKQRIITDIYDTYNSVLIGTEDGEKELFPIGSQAFEWTKIN